MRGAALGELLIDVTTWNPRREPSLSFPYIDIAAVDQVHKQVTGPTITLGRDAPSRARQVVRAGDVIVSTVRPNLNAVAAITQALDGATASTGFCVLRPSSGLLDSRYLFHWLQTDAFIADMVRKAAGASYPAVSDRIIKDSRIPLPPLAEQRRLAAILDQAVGLRRANMSVGDYLQQLFAQEFQRRFARLGAGGTVRPFGAHVSELVGGRSLVADDLEADTPYRVLKISAVTSGVFVPDESKPLPGSYVPPEAHLVKAGDLLMSRANTSELVGATALVKGAPANLVLPDKLWRIVWRDPEAIEPTYALALLQSRPIRQAMTRLASGTGGSMKNISKAKLLTMPFPVAPMAEQREFAAFAHLVTAQRDRAEYRERNLTALFRSLQTRAFAGEL